MLWGVNNGWLVAPRQIIVELERLDLSDIRTIGGDLDEKQLARAVMAEENLHGMAKPIVDFAGTDKQAIVFAASVDHATRLSELIRDYYVRAHGVTSDQVAVSIDGSMHPQHPRRVQIVKDFKEGRIQFLCNCGVATEGFDAPNVRLVAIGRPTKSRALYTQMIGRGTRPLMGIVDQPGMSVEDRLAAIAASDKKHVDVLDFIGQSGRHKLVCSASILAGDEPPDIIETANKISSNKDFKGTTLDAIEQAKEIRRLEKEAQRKKVTVGVEYRIREQGREVWKMDEMPQTFTPGFLMRKRPSEGQVKMLLRLGFTTAQIESMSIRQASANIDHAIRNPRTSFGRWLKQQKQMKGEM
jgi:superfamily II DNA or RNA helicase